MSAAIRYLLLSVQAGLAAGLLVVALFCIGGCYGLAESMVGIFVGGFVAIVTLTMLAIHHTNTKKTKPEALEGQATIQWWWLAISCFILLSVDF